MAEILEALGGIKNIVNGVITNNETKINVGKTQVHNSVEYTEATLYLHTYVHIPSIDGFQIDPPRLDKYELHHGLKAKVADLFTDLVEDAILREIKKFDSSRFEQDLRKHMDLQLFRSFVTNEIFDRVTPFLSFNQVDNAFKVIFHEISKRGAIRFSKKTDGQWKFEVNLKGIELHDDFSAVEAIFLQLFRDKSLERSISGVLEYGIMNSTELSPINYHIKYAVRFSGGVMVVDVELCIDGAWFNSSLQNLEFSIVEHLRQKQEVVGADAKVTLYHNQSVIRGDVAVRIGMT